MRTDCRICHGKSLEVILPLTPCPIGDDYLAAPKPQPLYSFDLYQCQDCGLVQLLEEIPPFHHEYVYYTGSLAEGNAHFAQSAKHAVDTCGLKRGDMVVDIGSNDGTILHHFKSLGMEVMGFEPEYKLAQVAISRGVPTIQSYFGKGFALINSNGDFVQAKLITANNVAANLYDLDAFMEGIVAFLAKDGTFILESFYLADILNNRVFDFIYHEQPSAFSIKPVKRLMRRYGLSLYRTEYTTGRNGLMRYYCGYDKPEVEDDNPILYEKKTYADLSQKIDLERDVTRSFLKPRKDKVIAGFGATVSATGIIYHFGLGEYLKFLVDDTQSKTGRFSPGLHLEVYPSSRMHEADYVVVFTWRLAEILRTVHPEVKFIVPLPNFHVA